MRKKLSLFCALIALSFSHDAISGMKYIVNHYKNPVSVSLLTAKLDTVKPPSSLTYDQKVQLTYSGEGLSEISWTYDGKTAKYKATDRPDINAPNNDTIVISEDGQTLVMARTNSKYIVNLSTKPVQIKLASEGAKAAITLSVNQGQSSQQSYIGNLIGMTINDVPFSGDPNANDTLVIKADGSSKGLNTSGVASGTLYIVNMGADSTSPIKLSSGIDGELSLTLGSWLDGKLSYWNNQKKDGLTSVTYKYKGQDKTYTGADLNTKDTVVIGSDGQVKMFQTGGVKRNVKYIANFSAAAVTVTFGSDEFPLVPPITTVSVGTGTVVGQPYWNNLKNMTTNTGKTYAAADINTKDTLVINEDGTLIMYQAGSQPKVNIKYFFNFAETAQGAILNSKIMGPLATISVARMRRATKYYIGDLNSITFSSQTSSDSAINTTDTAVLDRKVTTIKLLNTGGSYSQRTIINVAALIDWSIGVEFSIGLDIFFTLAKSATTYIDFPGTITGFKHWKQDKKGAWQSKDYTAEAKSCSKNIYIRSTVVGTMNVACQ